MGTQPFNLTAAILFVAAAGGLYTYFTFEKERMARQRIANQTKGMGKPKVGGPFELVDHNGKPFTHEDLLGRYSLVRIDNLRAVRFRDQLDRKTLSATLAVVQD